MSERTPATNSQKAAILSYLRRYGCITDAEAYKEHGCRRLGARVFDLRQEGYNIITDYGESTNKFGHRVRYAIYRLVKTA